MRLDPLDRLGLNHLVIFAFESLMLILFQHSLARVSRLGLY